MRLHRLAITGFGPFKERQEVDFDRFSDDGIFLIAGRTGAGKSSILDAVYYALFDGAPRYDRGEKRLRSDHCGPEDQTEVELEFTTGDTRWRITRSPEYLRPKRRGAGMTSEDARALLEEWDGEQWIGRAARPRDVGVALDEIVQLTGQQFLQVILLAQNRFARFLSADNAERQSLLRTLFGTRRFSEYVEALAARRKAAAAALDGRRTIVGQRLVDAESLIAADGLGGDADDAGDGTAGDGTAVNDGAGGAADDAATDGGAADAAAAGDESARIAAATEAVTRAAYRAATADDERDRAQRTHDDAESTLRTLLDVADQQRRRAAGRIAVDAIEARAPEIARLREERDAAAAADEVRPGLVASDRASAAATAAAELVTVLLDGAEPNAGADPTALSEDISRRTLAIGEWETARVAEAELPVLRAAEQSATAAAAAASEAVDVHDARSAELPSRRAALDLERQRSASVAARFDADQAAMEAAAARLIAARDASRLAADMDVAARASADANDAVAAATASVADLLRRRLDGAASDLAASLVAGEPCPVCGSASHPTPATTTHAPVTDDDLEAAEARKDAAVAADRTATAQLTDARSAHAAAAAAAGGADVETATAAHAAAVEAHRSSTAAVADVARIDQERDAVDAAIASAVDQRVALVAARDAARDRSLLAAQRASDAEALVIATRGDAASVAERVAAERAIVESERRLLAAVEDHAARARAAADAAAHLDELVRASPFETADDVRTALRDRAVRERLDADVRDWERDRDRERATLLDLELAMLPEEPVDIDAAQAARDAAKAAWVAAVNRAATSTQSFERLRGLVTDAAEAHERGRAEAEHFAVLDALANTVAGRGVNSHRMALETFVLAAELEEIVAVANRRLDEMSSGRYQLRHTDALAARGAASGLGIDVIDAYTGRARPTPSLSGGESFLASLALALGLAEVVTARAGGIRLDTLFIDEGFGSLDPETLNVAMQTLDSLRQGGRTVGLISHVESMKEQIPAQLRVEVAPQGWSTVIQA